MKLKNISLLKKFIMSLSLMAMVGVIDLTAGSLSFENVNRQYQRILSTEIKAEKILGAAAIEIADSRSGRAHEIRSAALIAKLDEVARLVPAQANAIAQAKISVQAGAAGLDRLSEQTREILAAVERKRATTAADLASEASFTITAARIFMPVAFAVFFGICTMGVVYGVTKPLKSLSATMMKLADGDLNVTIDGADRRDEIGQMAKSVEVFKKNALRFSEMEAEQKAVDRNLAEQRRANLEATALELEAAISNVVHSLATASNKISSEAQQLRDVSQGLGERIAATRDNAAVMSESFNQTAQATAQLNQSNGQLSMDAARQAELARDAADRTRSVEQRTAKFGAALNEINSVLGMISGIASQTNLLALNATIEAARAGHAGAGFAVVANEVKELAKETNNCAEIIRKHIEAIHQHSTETQANVSELNGFVSSVLGVAGGVSQAAHDQSNAIGQIAQSIAEAGQNADVVQASVSEINATAKTALELSGNLRGAADILAREAGTLRDSVDGFVAKLRAA